MKKLLLFLFAWLAGIPLIYSQNKIKGYQYWFDNNISSVKAVSISPDSIYSLSTSLPANSLGAGLHTFNVRFLDDSGRYSVALNTYFVKTIVSNITGYEYWIDNNYSSKTSQTLSPAVKGNINTPLNTGSISSGLHTFNIRFKDDSGYWSSVQIQYFYKTQQGKITGYQYWVDNNYASNTTQSISPAANTVLNTALAPGSLTPGLHIFNIRFMDDGGAWSSLQSQYFTVDNTANEIVSYRYWFDSIFNANNTHAMPALASIDSLKTHLTSTQTDSGRHAIHFQFRDKTGLWSSFTIDTFYKSSKSGIGAISPDSGANYTIDTILIQGNGFTDSAKVKLTYAGQADIVPTYFLYENANELKIALNLNGKKPGYWNLVITIPHDTIMTLDSSFQIYNGIFITGKIDTVYQASQKVTLHYTVPYPFDAGNVFTLQLINEVGKLSHALNIGTVSATDSGHISAMVPANLPASCGYEFRIIGSSPHVASLPSASFAVADIIAPAGDYALQFNGTSAFLDMGTWFDQDSFTISFWMNPDSVQGNGAGVMDIQNNLGFFFHDYNNAQNNYVLFNNLRQDLIPNLWQQVTLSVNGNTGVRKMYLFGQLVKQSTLSYSPASGHDMRMGNWTWNGLFGSTYWKGLIDEVKIYNYILSDSAVLAGVNKELTGNEPGLLAYWNFNDAQCASVSFDKTKNHRPAYLDSGLARVPSTVPNIGQQVIPNYGGNTDLITVKIYGAGFINGAIVKFKKTGHPDVVADSTGVFPGGAVITCQFDLNGADTGLYDVVVINPDTTTFTYPKSFTIQPGTWPDVWFDIVGKNVVQQGASNTVLFVFGNNGNVDAKVVPFNFAVSDSNTKVQLLFKTNNPSDSPSQFIDSELTLMPLYGNMDSLNDEPFNCKLYGFKIPYIPPNGTVVMGIRITDTTGTSSPKIIKAWIDSPLFQSPGISAGELDCYHDIASGVFGITLGLIPGVGCIGTVADKIGYKLYKAAKYGAQTVSDYDASVAWDVFDIAIGCLPGAKLVSWLKGANGNKVLKPAAKLIMKALDPHTKAAAEQIDKGFQVVGGLKSVTYNECTKQLYDKIHTMDQQQVGALDPNYKVGPSKFIKSTNPFAYTIGFENKPTATAPAQQVTIIDTLDKSKFDLRTFNFGIIGWGDSIYEPTYSKQKSFSISYNYVTIDSVIVRVDGRLDTASGVLRWKFTSLDPKTMNVPANPLIGFLPPDDSTHRGEGFVTYNLKLKQGFGTNTNVNNGATIIFDYNAPISTKSYKNVIDNTRPYSAINPITLLNDSIINVTWSGTDTGSGIMYYDIYFADNNDTFHDILYHTDSTHAEFKGQLNHTYKLFSLATDSAGNIETDTMPIRTITLTPTSMTTALKGLFDLRNIPNPFREECTIEFSLPENLEINLTVQNLYGNVISTVAQGKFNEGHYSYNFKSNDLAAGVYLIELNTPKGVYYTKMVIEK